jgi:hypothetical protein
MPRRTGWLPKVRRAGCRGWGPALLVERRRGSYCRVVNDRDRGAVVAPNAAAIAEYSLGESRSGEVIAPKPLSGTRTTTRGSRGLTVAA